MIVDCPSCTSRYRVRDEKISSRGARITCPSCTHRFVVHREDVPLVVGGSPSPVAGRGVPVTIARAASPRRPDVYDEDDESDVPTTVMPHGSQLMTEMRAAAEAKKALGAMKNREPDDPDADLTFEAPPAYDDDDARVASSEPVSTASAAADLRKAAQKRSGKGSRVVVVLSGVVVVAAAAAGALVYLGMVPMPGGL